MTVVGNAGLIKMIIQYKYVRLRDGRLSTHADPYISIFHTPRELDRHVSNKSLEASHYNKSALADSSDFGLLVKQSSPKWEILCPRRRITTVQNLTPLALSSAEKSVTVQTHKKNKQTNKQTKTHTNSKRYIHTLPIGTCG